MKSYLYHGLAFGKVSVEKILKAKIQQNAMEGVFKDG
jgi:hypothetical protein